MKNTYPPFMALCQHILEEGRYSGSTVIVDLDANSYEDLPLITWTFINDGQRDHGLWGGTLALTVLCEVTADENGDSVSDILSHVYKQVHSWEGPDKGELTSAKLGIESVTDGSIFDMVSHAELNGKDVAQFNAQFRLTILDWS